MERALHPEVSQVMFRVLPQTNRAVVSRARYSGLMEPTRAKLRVLPEDQRKADVKVLDVMDGMAFVEATTPVGACYFQMAWIDGKWKILNVLLKPKASPAQAPRQ